MSKVDWKLTLTRVELDDREEEVIRRDTAGVFITDEMLNESIINDLSIIGSQAHRLYREIKAAI